MAQALNRRLVTEARLADLIAAGANVTKSVNPASGVVTLTAAGGAGGGGIGNTYTVVQTTPDSATWTWSKTKSDVDAAHAGGATVYWAKNALGPWPTTADGAATGDLVNGTPMITVVISAGSVPVADDRAGTSGDGIILTKITGVSWVVDGVAYKSSEMVTATITVPRTTPGAVVVTAAPEVGYLLDAPTTSWTLTLTNTYQGVYTSLGFGAAGTTPLVMGTTYQTDAELGGTPVEYTPSASIQKIEGGRLIFTGPNGGLMIQYAAGTTSASVTLTIPVAGNALDIGVARNAASGTRCGVRTASTLGMKLYSTLAGATYDGSYAPISAGDTIRVDGVNGHSVDAAGVLTPDAGKCALRLYRNDVLVRTATIPALATFDQLYLGEMNTATAPFAEIDSVVAQVPAVQ